VRALCEEADRACTISCEGAFWPEDEWEHLFFCLLGCLTDALDCCARFPCEY
jgi:hypothetical protein